MTCFNIASQHSPGRTKDHTQELVMPANLSLYNIRSVLGGRYQVINSENRSSVMDLIVNKLC
jgi:hypothetical protein